MLLLLMMLMMLLLMLLMSLMLMCLIHNALNNTFAVASVSKWDVTDYVDNVVGTCMHYKSNYSML